MNPQEKKQAAILVVVTLIVLAGGFLWVRSVTGKLEARTVLPVTQPTPMFTPPPPADNPPPPGPGAAGEAKGPEGKAAEGKAGAGKTADEASLAAGQNPFRKVLPEGQGQSGPGTVQSSMDAAQAAVQAHRQDQLDRVQGKGKYAPGAMGGPPTGALPDASRPLVPTDTLNAAAKLQGIVSNAKGPMAVVSFMGSTLYLKPGDKFGDGIRVRRISAATATFTRAKKSYTVEIGGGLAPVL